MDGWTRKVWQARQYGFSWKEISGWLGVTEQQAKMKFQYNLEKIRQNIVRIVKRPRPLSASANVCRDKPRASDKRDCVARFRMRTVRRSSRSRSKGVGAEGSASPKRPAGLSMMVLAEVAFGVDFVTTPAGAVGTGAAPFADACPGRFNPRPLRNPSRYSFCSAVKPGSSLMPEKISPSCSHPDQANRMPTRPDRPDSRISQEISKFIGKCR